LSKDEKARADRFAFEKDRIQFVAGRGTLRKILGRYLDESPERLGFEIGSFGKPNLSNGNGWLRFNISHSRGMAVIAVALNREVGIDLEFVDQKFDVQGVAPSVFSEEEVNSLRSLLPDRQVDAFFTGWTRKEALLKAMGDGLSSSEEFQGIHIFIPDLNTSYKSFKNDRCTEWALTSFRVDDDFKAAIAVEGSLGAIRFLETFDAHDKQTGV
jgi:4'-phosphopantetheinyl transferase